MGRLKAWQNLNPLFSSGKYKKLLDDFGTKDYSELLLQESLQESLQDFVSYNCGNCGHIQKLQAEELNSIVGHAFRLAYAAHLQKSSSSVKDVIPSFSSSSSSGHFAYNQSQSQSSPSQTGSAAPSHNSRPQSRLQSHNTSSSLSTPYHSSQHHPSCSGPSTAPHTFTSEPTSPVCCSSTHIHHTLPHTLTHTHTDQRPCSSTCLSRAEFNRENLKAVSSCCSSRPHSRCSSNTATASVSSHCSKSLPFNSSEHSSTMRTPAPGNNISVGGQCGVLKPPSTLPGLHYNDHENNNNNLHSPDSDTSNSPTELNTTRRLGDKPPLIKNVNISLDTNLQLEEELNSVLSCPLNVTTTTQCPTMTATTTQQGNTSVIGYVNEKHGNDFQSNETCSSEDKCLLQEELNLKRMSQISMNSSLTSGNVGVEVSSSSNFSNTPPPLPERSDSLTPPEEPHLKTAAWFQAGIPREIALEVLSREPVGAFMVRESTSKPGCYALSLRVPRDFTVSGIAHYLIVKTTKGYKIKGFTKEFVTLTALITHHSVMPELLPCPLSLSRYNPTFTADDNRNDDDENSDEDPDYNTLSDFRKMMADLNV